MQYSTMTLDLPTLHPKIMDQANRIKLYTSIAFPRHRCLVRLIPSKQSEVPNQTGNCCLERRSRDLRLCLAMIIMDWFASSLTDD